MINAAASLYAEEIMTNAAAVGFKYILRSLVYAEYIPLIVKKYQPLLHTLGNLSKLICLLLQISHLHFNFFVLLIYSVKQR